eukprot:805341-Rhodomonas_salina.3
MAQRLWYRIAITGQYRTKHTGPASAVRGKVYLKAPLSDLERDATSTVHAQLVAPYATSVPDFREDDSALAYLDCIAAVRVVGEKVRNHALHLLEAVNPGRKFRGKLLNSPVIAWHQYRT